MNILLFLLLPALVVAAYAIFQWARNRQPTSVESGVDAFRREMTALSPDAAPVQRRPGDPGARSHGAPRPADADSRPPGAARPAPRRPPSDQATPPDDPR